MKEGEAGLSENFLTVIKPFYTRSRARRASQLFRVSHHPVRQYGFSSWDWLFASDLLPRTKRRRQSIPPQLPSRRLR